MKPFDPSKFASKRSHALFKLFEERRIPNPNPEQRNYVLPITAFEEYTGISVADHPLFFRPEVFSPGTDYNSFGDFCYLTINGLFKADTVLAVSALIRKENFYGKNQPA